MSLTPLDVKEKQDFFAFEKQMQKLADRFYIRRGWKVMRNSDKQKDLTLTKDAGSQKIEEKYRDCYRDDILIELIQDINSFSKGWLLETGCTFLHYFFCDREHGKILELDRINWRMFKPWFLTNFLPSHKLGNYVISPRGWGLTLNIPVPKNSIPKEMITIVKDPLPSPGDE